MNVCGGINDALEFNDVIITLFINVFTVPTGFKFNIFPDDIITLVNVVGNFTLPGNTISSQPAEDNPSGNVILKVYNVLLSTNVDSNPTLPVIVDGVAAIVSVPLIFAYPLFNISTFIGNVYLIEVGAVIV